MLSEEEGQQHEEASVVNDPPDVDGSAHLVRVLRVLLYVLGNENGVLAR